MTKKHLEELSAPRSPLPGSDPYPARKRPWEEVKVTVSRGLNDTSLRYVLWLIVFRVDTGSGELTRWWFLDGLASAGYFFVF